MSHPLLLLNSSRHHTLYNQIAETALPRQLLDFPCVHFGQLLQKSKVEVRLDFLIEEPIERKDHREAVQTVLDRLDILEGLLHSWKIGCWEVKKELRVSSTFLDLFGAELGTPLVDEVNSFVQLRLRLRTVVRHTDPVPLHQPLDRLLQSSMSVVLPLPQPTKTDRTRAFMPQSVVGQTSRNFWIRFEWATLKKILRRPQHFEGEGLTLSSHP
jgi:hypothetical protein